jgi:3-hydroxyisobutyrate dehydrogenase-like beta-hydroxyacid dehydrogenase
VWNRTVAKTEALSRLGVSDYSSTRQLLAQPEIEAALRGKIVVQLSSGTPKDAREMDSGRAGAE